MGAEINSSLYYKIYEDMMEKIRTGCWSSGEKLPIEAELCERYSASRITIRRALQMLEDEGYLERTPRKGTFVRSNTPEIQRHPVGSFGNWLHVLDNTEDFHNLLVRFEKTTCPTEACHALHLTENDDVYYLERVRYKGAVPFAFSYSVLPCSRIINLNASAVRDRGLYDAIRFLGGLAPDHAKETFHALLMDSKTAKRLHKPSKTPALSVQRVGFCNNTPIEFSKSVLADDSVPYEIDIE